MGKPRMRWEDYVRKDVADYLSYEVWHMSIQNCDEWKRLCLNVRSNKNKVIIFRLLDIILFDKKNA